MTIEEFVTTKVQRGARPVPDVHGSLSGVPRGGRPGPGRRTPTCYVKQASGADPPGPRRQIRPGERPLGRRGPAMMLGGPAVSWTPGPSEPACFPLLVRDGPGGPAIKGLGQTTHVRVDRVPFRLSEIRSTRPQPLTSFEPAQPAHPGQTVARVGRRVFGTRDAARSQ